MIYVPWTIIPDDMKRFVMDKIQETLTRYLFQCIIHSYQIILDYYEYADNFLKFSTIVVVHIYLGA